MSNDERSFLDQFWDALVDIGDRAGRLGVVHSLEHLLGLDEHEIDLAYAVLLVNIGAIDNDFAPRESYYIKQKLKSELGVEYLEAEKLVEEAKRIVESDKSLVGFGRFLRDRLSLSKREKLISVIEQLIDEDRVDHPFEEELLAKYRKVLLG